jgi:hypothetical protein
MSSLTGMPVISCPSTIERGADPGRLERKRQVVVEVGDAVDFDAGRGFEFKTGDDRPGFDIDYLAADAEFHEPGGQ